MPGVFVNSLNEISSFVTDFRETSHHISNFTRIRPLEAELINADRHDEDNRRLSRIMRQRLKVKIKFCDHVYG